MKRKDILAALLIGACILTGAYHIAAAQASIDEKSVLAGTVSWTAQPGSSVQQGSPLVKINTLTGESAASRASQDGTVKEILVQPGDKVAVGQVVARIFAQ